MALKPTPLLLLLIAMGMLSLSSAQQPNSLDSSAPFSYPGMPTTPYGPDWQSYYRVTDPLPGVRFTIPGTYAGSISVDREGHPNNTLFFIGFEREEGSLTATMNERLSEPWIIWLNGGPGSSSLFGLFAENGPMLLGIADGDTTGQNRVVRENPWSWHKQADIIYVDQPVGTGYSTVDSSGYVADEDQMAEDFVKFLTNLGSVFPSLRRRPLYLTGESYAGIYIPYIAKAVTINTTTSPPVSLSKIAIGDGTIGNYGAAIEYSTLSLIQSYPQLIGFESSVYEYFVEQYNLCGYNITLEYPANRPHPTIRNPYLRNGVTSKTVGISEEEAPLANSRWRGVDAMAMIKDTLALYKIAHDTINGDELSLNGRTFVKRQQTESAHFKPIGRISPWYGCFVMESLWDYAMNHTVPWKGIDFDVYRVSNAHYPAFLNTPEPYMNMEAVRTAFHAPRKNFRMSIWYPFNSSYQFIPGNPWGDPSPEPQLFLSDIAKHVPIVLFAGNDDSLVGHRGTELAIQNTTFGGIRGFTVRPSTPFSDTDGNFAGIVHQERNVTYALFNGAGHMVPTDRPKAAYAFLQEFILGANTTGLVISTGDQAIRSPSVVGGVHTEYLKGILTATEAYTGSYVTQGVYTWAEESWKAWGNYMASRTDADVPVASATGDGIVAPGSLEQSGHGTRLCPSLRSLLPWAIEVPVFAFYFSIL